MQIITRADAIASGLKRYFTGQPCCKGHIKERRVSDHGCVECSRLKARDPTERDRRRDYMIEHQRNYRQKHPDRIKGYRAKLDKAKLAANRRARRAENPEPDRAALRRSYQKHKAKRAAAMKEWNAKNPERRSWHLRLAKAKRLNSEGLFTKNDIANMLVGQKGLCAACSVDIRDDYHIDHIIPLSRGGTNWPDNLQLLCPRCNISKGYKTMEEWEAWKVAIKADPGPPGRRRRA